MIMVNKKCNECGAIMIEKSSQQVGDTIYYILFCEKCRHQVARSE